MLQVTNTPEALIMVTRGVILERVTAGRQLTDYSTERNEHHGFVVVTLLRRLSTQCVFFFVLLRLLSLFLYYHCLLKGVHARLDFVCDQSSFVWYCSTLISIQMYGYLFQPLVTVTRNGYRT